MASIRLTHHDRENIVNKLLAHAFEARVRALMVRERDLMIATYTTAFRPADRARWAAAPKGDFKELEDIRIRHDITGNTLYLRSEPSFHGALTYAHSAAKQALTDANELGDIVVRVPASKCDGYVAAIDRTTSLGRKLVDYFDDKDALLKQAKDDQSRLNGLLNTFSTTKQVIDAWPELEPFLPKHKVEDRSVPTVQREELNKHFGLPVS